MPNVQSRVFPSVTNEQPFQDQILSKTIILTHDCFVGDLNNECTEASPVSPA